MRQNNKTKKSTQLGELVASAFEEACRLTTDPRRAAVLATAAVRRILLASGQDHLVRLLATG
jgi:hypothetical protein